MIPKICNQCGGRGRCINTRGKEAGGEAYTYRRYACARCDNRWTTYEVRVEEEA